MSVMKEARRRRALQKEEIAHESESMRDIKRQRAVLEEEGSNERDRFMWNSPGVRHMQSVEKL